MHHCIEARPRLGEAAYVLHGPCSPVLSTGAETAGRKGGRSERDGHLTNTRNMQRIVTICRSVTRVIVRVNGKVIKAVSRSRLPDPRG